MSCIIFCIEYKGDAFFTYNWYYFLYKMYFAMSSSHMTSISLCIIYQKSTRSACIPFPDGWLPNLRLGVIIFNRKQSVCVWFYFFIDFMIICACLCFRR